MKVRTISAPMLALIVGFVVLLPMSAVAQQGRLLVGTDVGIWVPATDRQILRVTVGSPYMPDQAAKNPPRTGSVVLFDYAHSIRPGESFTYTIDPREVGTLVDPRLGLRHVRVSFRFEAEVLENESAPRPTLMIEVLNRKTGALESFQAFPGFTGGVYVAAGDAN